MKSRADIEALLTAHKPALLAKSPIEELAFFGSYAREEQIPESDVDIMVLFYEPVGYEFIDLAEEIEAILGEKVELVSKKGIKPPYFEFLKADLIYI